MYRLFLGKISTLSTRPLPQNLAAQAPQGSRRASWLAGRVLLAQAVSPLPEIIYAEHGKPGFSGETGLWFNLSHSGDDIALLLSDEGEVGCDIEVIRPRPNWRRLANAVFSLGEHAEVEAEHPERQLDAFWRIWTRKEAMVKQARRQRLADCQRRQHTRRDAPGQSDSACRSESGGLHANAVCVEGRQDSLTQALRFAGQKIVSTPAMIISTPSRERQWKGSCQPGNQMAAAQTRM